VEIIGLLLAPVVLISFVWLLISAFKKNALWGVWVLIGPLLVIILSIWFIQPGSVISILLISILAFIPPISFAYKCWEEARKPFLTYIISSVLSLLISVSSLATLGDDTLPSLIAQAQQGILSEPDAAKRLRQLIQKMENSASLTAQEKLNIRTAENIIKLVKTNLSKDPQYYSRKDKTADLTDTAAYKAQQRKEESIKKLEAKLNQRTTIEKTLPPKQTQNLPEIKKSEIKKYIGSTIIILTTEKLRHKGILKGFDEVGYNIILEKERKTGKLQFNLHMSDIKNIYLYINE